MMINTSLSPCRPWGDKAAVLFCGPWEDIPRAACAERSVLRRREQIDEEDGWVRIVV
jgi:hypothetical protein